MPITVYSPHSGNPVKVRDQDAGRAVKDEEGRIFYVLPKSDGSGYYGAMSRSGNPKEEARANELESKVDKATQQVHEQVEEVKKDDAGNGRRGKVLVASAVVVVLFLIWLFTLGPFNSHRLWTHTVPLPPREIPVGGGQEPVSGVHAPSDQIQQSTPTPDAHDPTLMDLPNGLKYRVDRQGNGAVAKTGDRVEVRYVGKLSNGVEFDASTTGVPFELTVGARQNLRFWNEALPGMAEGEKRTLIVPPALHYGAKGNDIVPPDETVTYQVELLHIVSGSGS